MSVVNCRLRLSKTLGNNRRLVSVIHPRLPVKCQAGAKPQAAGTNPAHRLLPKIGRVDRRVIGSIGEDLMRCTVNVEA